jgi:disulfide oxidoreductase YuzD
MADAKNREAYPDFANAVEINRWSLPLVAIDGKIWFTGYVDHRSIVQVIEKKRAALQGEQP